MHRHRALAIACLAAASAATTGRADSSDAPPDATAGSGPTAAAPGPGPDAASPAAQGAADATTPTLLVPLPAGAAGEYSLLDEELYDGLGPYLTLIPHSPSAPRPPEGPPPPGATRFIKGDLIYPGTRRLLSRFDHVGVGVGAMIFAGDVWATLTPGMAWYLDGGLALSFQVPLRLRALEVAGTTVGYGGLRVRRQDWDEPSDFAKLVRFITYGRKEANLYATINSLRPATIGHGMLLAGYQGDIDVDRTLTGLVFDAYNDFAGCQLQLNDVTFANRVLGGLAFVKPLAWLSDDARLRSLSVGVEYLADLLAPRCIKTGADGACVMGSGQAAGFDPYSGAALDESFVRSDPELGRYHVERTTVHALGSSVELKFHKDQTSDLKAYGTYHQYLNEGGGAGASLGLLARLNLGETWINALRLRGEYRTWGDGFWPSYFNTLYEVQKYEYLARARSFQVTPTKYQQVFGDPAHGFARPTDGQRHGFHLDLSWGLFKWSRSAKQIAAGVGLQQATGPHATSLYGHLELPLLEVLQLFATYLAFDADGLAAALAGGDSSVAMAGLRLQVLPFLFVNAHYAHSFRAIASPGTELHLGNERIVDSAGRPDPNFPPDRLFEPVHMFFAELELGWEFMAGAPAPAAGTGPEVKP